VELQQIGLGHPRIKQVLDIQRNAAPNPRRLFVAEGLWAHNLVLETGAPVETFFWCPEAIYSDEARTRSVEIAARAVRAYRVSPKTMERSCRAGPARRPAVDRATAAVAPDDLTFGADASCWWRTPSRSRGTSAP
jgi:TrmH family RNA methyltransferase